MTTSQSHPAGLNRRGKTLLAAGGGLLVVVLILAAGLALSPNLRQRLAGALLGTAASYGKEIRPKSVGETARSLARNTWEFSLGAGYYVVLWDWDAGSTRNRKWEIEPVDKADGTYVYIYQWYTENTKKGKEQRQYYLAAYNMSKDAGADVIAYWGQGTDNPAQGANHIWQMVDGGIDPNYPGVQWYQIKNKYSGLCLDLRDGSTSNGAALIQSGCDNSKESQLFRLIAR